MPNLVKRAHVRSDEVAKWSLAERRVTMMENSDHFGDTVLSSKASDMREDFLMLNAITATGRGKINKELNIEIRPARTVARLVLCCNLDADI